MAIFCTVSENRLSLGSGSFIDDHGTILTAYHVVVNARTIEVNFDKQTYTDITVLAVDPKRDLAIIKVNSPVQNLQHLQVASASPTFTGGEPVTLYGHSAELFNQTVTASVSRPPLKSQALRDPITSAPIFALPEVTIFPITTIIFNGLSGGPMMWNSQLVGIVSGSLTEGGSIAWAIPVTEESLSTLQSINASPGKFAWPPFELMAGQWNNLRAEITVSGRLVRAIERFSELMTAVMSSERTVKESCIPMRKLMEISISTLKTVVNDNPDALLKDLPGSTIQTILAPITDQSRSACMEGVAKFGNYAQPLGSAFEEEVGSAVEFVHSLTPSTTNYKIIKTMLDKSVAQQKEMATYMPLFPDGLVQASPNVQLNADSKAAVLLDVYQKLWPIISYITSPEGAGHIEGALLVLLHYGDTLEILLQAEEPTTTVTISKEELLSALRKKTESISDSSERVTTAHSIDELEKTYGSDSFLTAYQAFVSEASKNITLFAPFFPALNQMLMGKL
ncbi:trypsin-like peptidase domain-containing protein [Tunturiibacter psychrotolerans]|uniref:trypsin-like peptidase domain-containing protein n=1 Tax=Tunturiibacter psychrotolerans TaxID=3069686 RepID=UPI003D1BCB9A